MKTEFVGLVQLALKIDVRMSLGQLILGGDQVSIEPINAECRLELIVSGIRSGLSVYVKSLIMKVSVLYAKISLVSTHLTEFFQVALLICVHEGLPSVLG